MRWMESRPKSTESNVWFLAKGFLWVAVGASVLGGLLFLWWRVGRPQAEAVEMTTDTQAVSVTEVSEVAAEPDVVVQQTNPSEEKKQIALTFDDGPHPHYTPLILDILKEYDVRATFFMIGENVRYYHDVAEAVLADGHEIGNHTYSHARLDQLSREGVVKQISACEDEIASLQEYRPRFFRPPEGHLSDMVKQVSDACDYRLVLWDVDTRDWAHTPPSVICQKVLEDVKPGDIILMHDFVGHNSPTPDALRMLIPALQERGFELVTVGELMNGD